MSSVQTIYFGAGCFWGVEEKFRTYPGVLSTEVGYGGGDTDMPTYKDVCRGDTGHVEVVKVEFNPSICFELIKFFFDIHDASQLNRQGVDIGEQYRSAIFTTNEEQKKSAFEALQSAQETYGQRKIVTVIEDFKNYYKAEEYHQKYALKNGWTCAN